MDEYQSMEKYADEECVPKIYFWTHDSKLICFYHLSKTFMTFNSYH